MQTCRPTERVQQRSRRLLTRGTHPGGCTVSAADWLEAHSTRLSRTTHASDKSKEKLYNHSNRRRASSQTLPRQLYQGTISFSWKRATGCKGAGQQNISSCNAVTSAFHATAGGKCAAETRGARQQASLPMGHYSVRERMVQRRLVSPIMS